MIINILTILAGIALVLWGADRLTDGAVGIAQRMRIPQLVIGLTIVAMGTSMPEFCVSLVSAIEDKPDLAVGNVVGSNIFNTLFIVGITALVAPITISRVTVAKDIPFALVSSALLMILCINDWRITRVDAAVLFALFVVFMVLTIRGALESRSHEEDVQESTSAQPMKVWKACMWIVVGLACLIFGSDWFFKGATAVAKSFNISDAVIGLTIVACGTSLPELATSVVSARKGDSGIAIGNVLGSNVFNILFILGGCGLICPMNITGITNIDLSLLVISIMLLWLFSFTKYTICRWEGAVLSLTFVGYMVWLVCGV